MLAALAGCSSRPGRGGGGGSGRDSSGRNKAVGDLRLNKDNIR